jgi:hypothetical protein
VEEALTLALILALGGDRLAGLAEAWNASVLGQALGVWAAVMGRRRRTGGALRGLGAFLLGSASRSARAGGRKLVRIMLRWLIFCSSSLEAFQQTGIVYQRFFRAYGLGCQFEMFKELLIIWYN